MITSVQNQKIKNLVRLREKSSERRETGLFLVEGAREIERALQNGFVPVETYAVENDLSPLGRKVFLELKRSGSLIMPITTEVFGKLAMREDSDGLIVVCQQQNHTLASLKPHKPHLMIVLEAVEKPGNLGAILRSADGAGVTSVVVLEQKVDVYNPNAIRASVGAIFSVPVVVCDAQDFWDYCRQERIATYAATPHASPWYFECDFREASAVLMGSEAHGLSKDALQQSQYQIKIPMQGTGDSLNVSVAAGILAYEACRQRLLRPT